MGQSGITDPAQKNLSSHESVSGGGGGGGGGSDTGGDGLVMRLEKVLVTLAAGPAGVILTEVLRIVGHGVTSLLQGEEIYRTFLRSSTAGIDQASQFRGINLSLLEGAPVLGAVVGAGVVGVRSGVGRLHRALDATDALTVAVALVFVLIYNPKLPLNTQVTVRYLLILYPLGIVLLARSTVVRTLLDDHWSTLLWAYVCGVAIGGQLLLAYLVVGQYAVGEAARVHALLGFGLGIAVALTSLGSVSDRRLEPAAAATLGLAGATATVFFLLATLWHFGFVGEYVLPIAGALSDVLAGAG